MEEIITVLSSDVSILSSIAVSRLIPSYLESGTSEKYPNEDYKFLVSEPNDNIATGHISKFVSLSSIGDKMMEYCGIEEIHEELEELSAIKSNRREVELGDTGMTIECSIEYPYVISSITETNNGNICAIGGYRLSSAMDFAFKSSKFSIIKSEQMEVDECDDEPTLHSNSVLNSNTLKKTMNKYFMDDYSTTNQIAHKDFVNSSIDHVAAYYITKKHNGETIPSTFRTYADLSSAQLTDLYWGTERRNPTKNDYCVVLSDETKMELSGGYGQTARYIFTRLSCDESTYNISCWSFQYILNASPFTDAQWKAINSGIRQDLVSSMVSDTDYASTEKYGIVKIGSNINVENGVISVDFTELKNKIDAQITRLQSIV